MRLIDALPCAGLSVHGDLLYRVTAMRQNDGAELLVYDAQGVFRYHRIDGVGDPHDVLALDRDRVLCVSTTDNAIVQIARDGSASTYWRADAPLDAWHLNCLCLHDGRLFATAFGRHDVFRGWRRRTEPDGVLFDVESGELAVTGLQQPHTPRWIDGAWVICNSGALEVVRIEPNGHRFAIPVGGFSRGMCAVGDYVYVGVSVARDRPDRGGTGLISVIDRERWREVDRIPTPCGGMYDLIEVDAAMLRGLEAGFHSGTERERYFGQLAMFEQVGVTPLRMWAVADPLPEEHCRVKITAGVPAAMAVGDVARIACTVENAGDGFFVSAPPHPVEVCYRWFDAEGTPAGGGTWLHSRLPRVLPPRDSVTYKILVAPPPSPGRFTLRVTLLQEGVRWFDDLDPANSVTREVHVYTPRAVGAALSPAADAEPEDPRPGAPAGDAIENVRAALDTLSAIRSASEELRAMLARERAAAVSHAQPSVGADMTRALAERDRRAAHVQHEADARLAALELVSAECARLREHIAALTAEIQSLQTIAKDRLSLLEKNERAHERDNAALEARLQDIADSIVAALRGRTVRDPRAEVRQRALDASEGVASLEQPR